MLARRAAVATSAAMDLDDQIRHYFGSDTLNAVPPPALAAGIERMTVDLWLERDRARRFALWTLLYMFDAAPPLDEVFAEAADRDAARNWMDLSARLLPED